MSGLEPGGEYRTELKQWMDNLDSPLVSNHQDIAGQDGKCLRLRFDVSEYRPEEISVKTVQKTMHNFRIHREESSWNLVEPRKTSWNPENKQRTLHRQKRDCCILNSPCN